MDALHDCSEVLSVQIHCAEQVRENTVSLTMGVCKLVRVEQREHAVPDGTELPLNQLSVDHWDHRSTVSEQVDNLLN